TGWGLGDHSLEGILIAHGPEIAPGRLEDAALVDVAPTALYLLGRPVPATMDGRVLSEALAPALLASRPVQRQDQSLTGGQDEQDEIEIEEAPLTPEEEIEVRDRLRGLGYL
ncbi:MAG: phosphodiesterase, partial [Anaerolineae bacterium]